MNKLSLDVSNTSYVLLNRRKQIYLSVTPRITLKNAALERDETVEFLGVYLDEGPNWKLHINYISR